MKKFLFGFFALLCASYAFAGAWTAPTGFPVQATADTIKTAIYPSDSLKAADTIVLFKNVMIDPTCTYAVWTQDSVGAADTAQIMVQTYLGDKTTIANTYTPCDTLNPVAGASSFYRVSALTVNKTVFGRYMTVSVTKWIAAKNAIIRKAALIKVKPITPIQTQFDRP